MKNRDTILHVRGESRFVDDEPLPSGLLYAAVVPSPVAHGHLRSIDTSAAKKADGVVAVFTSKEIPGENQIGGIIQDEPLLADAIVDYVGQPVALVVAREDSVARRAARTVKMKIDPLPAVFDPREAYAKGELIAPQRTFELGDIGKAWDTCDVVITGRADSGAQEHIYLETQGAMAIPVEGGGLRILSATQSPTTVQRTVSKVMGLPMHKVEVDVRRLGGGFGGKEDQATAWAALAALAARKLDRPVKLVLRRSEDVRWTGKRHPYSSDFRIGLKADGTIVAYEPFFYQNAGAAADLSTAILERTLFHCTNSYFIPNVKATAASCRTNLPPNTAFRGFGGPQAMFVLESAIFQAARELQVDPSVIQKKNLLKEGDSFPYGQRFQSRPLLKSYEEAERLFDIEAWRARIAEFNASHRMEKKGLALQPVCFGISFTNTMLNQASSLVHVYADGSVGVSTGAVEMGQGVNAKIQLVAAETLSIDPELVRIESTSTARVANTSPTAASSSADLNGNATRLACLQVLGRLKEVAAKVTGSGDVLVRDGWVCANGRKTEWDWKKLVGSAYASRVSLSAQAHYVTPDIHFDKKTEKGEPFAYHATGTAVTEVTIDGLRGTLRVDAVRAIHDVGKSLDRTIDRGQAEGALIQGIGWMTMEEILHDPTGKIVTDTLTTYKVPDLYAAPADVEFRFAEGPHAPVGVVGAKAIGEPPFMYGIGTYFAALNALRAFRPGLEPFFHAPLTSERILMTLTATGR
ncbi:MAG: molybdopterin cofactor-binding domain-containing protein [Pseudomonadota bacterium]